MYLRVALENRRNKRIVCWFVTEVGKLCVAHSCIAYGEHCKLVVLSVVYSHSLENFQTQVRNSINNSKTLIPQDTRWRYINTNPSAPTIKGLIKIHKPEHPIRPVVNWRNAPAYKLAGLFTREIKWLAPLPHTHTHNISNTIDLINKLKDTPTLPHYGLASLDIANLYTNVPVKETRDIISSILERLGLNPQIRHELLEWYDVITL